MSQDFRARQTQTSQVISSGSSGTNAKIVFYDVSAQSTVNPNQGIIDNSLFNTSSIGTDIFLYVSGGIGKKDVGDSNAITVFGGDVHVSGNLTLEGFGNVSTNLFRLTVTDYATTANTSSNPEVVGQAIFDGQQFSGSLTLRAIVNSALSGAIAVIKLYELTSASYVDIAGPSQQELAVTGTTPTVVESVNLYNANGFIIDGQGKYELRLFTATSGVAAFVGGAELKPSGTFTNLTIITSSANYFSGTWIDDNNRLRTTASVAINTDGLFAQQYGSDVYFYVSGTLTSGSSSDRISVFGGSVRVSGVLAIGPGTTFISSSTINFTNANADTGAVFKVDNIEDGSALVGLEADVTIAASTITVSGTGGSLNLTAGGGGYTHTFNGKHPGGDINFDAGNGGIIGGPGSDGGSAGGTVTMVAGAGGDSIVGARTAGAGGNVQMFAGNGGQNLAVVGNGGDGGSIYLTAGGGSAGVSAYGNGGNVEISSGNTFGVSGSPGSIRLLPGVNTFDSIPGYVVIASSYNDERVQDAFLYISGTIETGSSTSRNTVFQGSLITSGSAGFRNPQFPPGYGYISLDSSGDLNFFDTNNPGGFTLSALSTAGGENFWTVSGTYITTSSSLALKTPNSIFQYTGSLFIAPVSGGLNSASLGIRLYGGDGGYVDNTSHSQKNGGNVEIYTGTGSNTANPIQAGNGGDFRLSVGKGGNSGTGIGGNGGNVIITAGTGGNSTSTTAGVGGGFQFIAGNGGTGFGPAAGGGFEFTTGRGITGGGGSNVRGGSVIVRLSNGGDPTTETARGGDFIVTGAGDFSSYFSLETFRRISFNSPNATSHGRDVFLFVSGGIGQKNGNSPVITLFGGDVHISGNLTVSGSGQGNDYWQSTVNRIIFTTGSIRQGTAVTINTAATNSVALSSQGSSTLAGLSNAMLSTDASHIRNSSGTPSHVKSNTIASDTFSAIDGDSAIGDTQYNFIGAGFAHTVNSGAQYNAILGSVGLRVTTGSTACGALGAGDPSFTITSIFDNAIVSAMIAGGPNVISSSDGTPVTSIAAIGGNWTLTSSYTYAIGDTINDAKVLLSASRGVDITGQTIFRSGLSGSLTRLADGTPYLLAGANITLSTGANGAITIAAVTGSAGAAGSTNEIQYNLAGALTASNNFWIEPGVSVNVTGAMNVSGNLSVGGGVRYNPTFVTASRAIVTSEYIIGVSASATLTLTLPSSPLNGQSFIVKDAVGNATTNNIIVSSSGPQIDGSSTYTIAVNYGSAQFVYFANPATWGVI